MRDPMKPPAWVRQAMRDRADGAKVRRVKPDAPASSADSLDAYIDDLMIRAPKTWHDAMTKVLSGKP